MDEYRSDETLRHFHTRSAGLCKKAPIHSTPVNVNFYTQYDHPSAKMEQTTSDKFTYVGTSTKPTQYDISKARRTAQMYMADN